MKRILVTGCAGFIGSNLCATLLAEGYRVLGIDNLSAGRRQNLPPGVEFFERDIRDLGNEELMKGVDAVFHLAARNCLLDCLRHPVETADVNVTGTVRVLEACRAAGVAKVIYADTSAVYEGVDELPSREDRVAPRSPYAISKHAGARFVESYGELHGLKYTILRYFNVYGPAQDRRRLVPPVMTAFMLKLLAGEQPVIYGTGQKRRDFVHVDDVNRFHLATLHDPRTDGRVFNVGTGKNYSVLEIYREIEELMGSRLRPRFEPDLPGEARETLADLSAARSVGFEPRVDLNEGLARSRAELEMVVNMTEQVS